MIVMGTMRTIGSACYVIYDIYQQRSEGGANGSLAPFFKNGIIIMSGSFDTKKD